MGIFSTTKKRRIPKEMRVPKAPKKPKQTGTKKQWDDYAEKLGEYNKQVDSVNKEKARRKALTEAKAKIDKKK